MWNIIKYNEEWFFFQLPIKMIWVVESISNVIEIVSTMVNIDCNVKKFALSGDRTRAYLRAISDTDLN